MFLDWLAVIAGGALGAGARFALALRLPESRLPFSWSTLAANALGCLLFGYLASLPSEWLSHRMRLFLLTGIMGSLTTFSTWISEINSAGKDGWAKLLSVLLIHLVLGIVLFIAGQGLARLHQLPPS